MQLVAQQLFGAVQPPVRPGEAGHYQHRLGKIRSRLAQQKGVEVFPCPLKVSFAVEQPRDAEQTPVGHATGGRAGKVLELGDRLWLGKKITGTFTLDRVPDNQHLVLIATGTGLAPYISMLRSRLLHARTGKVAVLHGARHSWDLGYCNELALVERDHANFAYIPSITRPSGEKTRWHGEVGRMQEIWLRDPLRERWGFSPEAENTHILMCGNPAMIDTLIEVLGEQGYKEHTKKSPGNIHLERYW